MELIDYVQGLIRLYIYWGDAIQVSHRGVHNKELIAARREAVMPYLYGLKKTLQYDLPEIKPELQRVNLITYDGPPDSNEYKDIMRKHQEEIEARKKAKFQRNMVQLRDILTRQISSMYSRFPWASDEIRELATNILEDKTVVDRLMYEVDTAVQVRSQELGLRPSAPGKKMLKFLNKSNENTATIGNSNNKNEITISQNKIFIPDVNSALMENKAFVLDFKSRKLINYVKVNSKKSHRNFLKFGKGDIAWDGTLITVREAKTKTVITETDRPLKFEAKKYTGSYELPADVELPYSLMIVTKEQIYYLVNILEVKSKGIEINYRNLTQPEADNYLLKEHSNQE